MLKGIPPILNAEVLHALRAMGHGDDLVICDANFPAASVAEDTVRGELLRIDRPVVEVVRAVLALLPLDTFVEDAVARMQVVGEPDTILPVMQEVQAEVDAAAGEAMPLCPIERFAFYDRAREAYAVIQTSERRFYGCFAFRKGVFAPEVQLGPDA